MSAYTTVQTQLVSAEHLKAALMDLGFQSVELHQNPQNLEGFQGDQRAQKAEVIIRRKHLGMASNDLGFKRLANGRFEAVISDFDRPTYNLAWLQKLTQRYAYHVAKDMLREQEFDMVKEEIRKDNTIHLVMRRME